MKRVLLAAALLGCSLRDPHVTASSCTASSQCTHANICFLGECRAPASSLSVVVADVRPPTDSAFGARRTSVDLRLSAVNDFDVGPSAALNGTVSQQPATPIGGATVTMTEHAPLIPDRVDQVVAISDPNSGAFQARLPPGVWDVVVTPPPARALPPVRPAAVDTTAMPPSLDVALPQDSALVSLHGVLLANGTTPLAGAGVTALDLKGVPISATTVSQGDGSYTLSLLPGTTASLLQIGPAAAAGGSGSAITAPDPFPSYDPVPFSASVSVPLPEVVTIQGTVLDSTGNPVPSAIVYARSISPGWTLARSVSVNADGTYSLKLRAGGYLLEAAPPADATAPALSTQQVLTLTASATIDFRCPPKVRRYGFVLGPDGRAIKNVQVIATRLSDLLVTTRNGFTISTDGTGMYHVVADPGTWRFDLVPPADSGLPRSIVRLALDNSDLGEEALPTANIPHALNAGGTVRGGAQGQPANPIAGATVNFYSLDSTGRSILLGTALTDSVGRYSAVLPDVADPSSGP